MHVVSRLILSMSLIGPFAFGETVVLDDFSGISASSGFWNTSGHVSTRADAAASGAVAVFDSSTRAADASAALARLETRIDSLDASDAVPFNSTSCGTLLILR